jgi:TatD DNase family protein
MAGRYSLIDSHCHLADEAFIPDIEPVINRAREAGLTGALVILAAGDQNEASRFAAVNSLWPETRCAIGVHPHQAHQFAGRPTGAVDTVRSAYLRTASARAIGEIGLDYHYDFSPRDVQLDVFRVQIRLAREMGVPVVIHTRDAEHDTLAILADEGPIAGVLHCFIGGAAAARRGLELGLHVSFAGIVTFPKAAELRDVAKGIPEHRILVETDSPFLAPVPNRGKRNEPAWVSRVVEALAEVRQTTPEAVAEVTSENFRHLFRP